jgi:hypothetical protein
MKLYLGDCLEVMKVLPNEEYLEIAKRRIPKERQGGLYEAEQ